MKFQKFYYDWVVKETYLDFYGHVNNASYIRIFEEARWEFVTEKGYGIDTINKTQIGPVVLGLSTQFRKEVKGREKIRIETQVTDFRGKVSRISQKLFLESGDLACAAEFDIGLMDFKTRRLISPTPEWLKALGVEEA